MFSRATAPLGAGLTILLLRPAPEPGAMGALDSAVADFAAAALRWVALDTRTRISLLDHLIEDRCRLASIPVANVHICDLHHAGSTARPAPGLLRH